MQARLYKTDSQLALVSTGSSVTGRTEVLQYKARSLNLP